jgi:transcriptional regulator with XRE-family HTH domain
MNYAEMVVRLKRLHRKQSWSVSKISKLSGVSKPTISRILNGHRVRDKKILSRLGVTRTWHHLDDLSADEVRFIFNHRETL